jgi:hypothetical protein
MEGALSMRAIALLVGIISLGVTSLACAQTIYKWVDTEGITNFSAQPPLGVNAERTSTRLHEANRQALQTRIDNSAERNAAVNTRKQQDKEQAAETQAQDKEQQELRIENCAKAKTRLIKYNTSRRLYRQLEDGEREYLSDDELDQERTGAQQLVNEWCD